MKGDYPMSEFLTKVDQHILRGHIFLSVDVMTKMVGLGGSWKARQIIRILLSRTLNKFGRVEAEVPSSIFIDGSPEDLLDGCGGGGSRQFYRVRKKLEEAKLFHRDGNKYRLNLPGIAALIIRNHTEALVMSKEVGKLHAIANKLIAFWKKNKWRIEKVARIEDELSALKERKTAEKEKRDKKRDEQNLRVGWIQPFMRDVCKENSIPYHDTWTNKDRGCARNWLRYCAEEGVDPRVILKEVCTRWSLFSQGLRDQRGNLIHLLPTPNFPEFFKYRREIGSFMSVREDEVPIRLVYKKL